MSSIYIVITDKNGKQYVYQSNLANNSDTLIEVRNKAKLYISSIIAQLHKEYLI